MPIDVHELMKQVGQIRILTTRLVTERVAGEYHSVFKGHGIEFDEVREYTPDDDVRSIDWNVTARMGAPYVKRFCEERELTVVFVVDVSASQHFGSGERTKADVAAEFASVLALSALRNQDKVGLLLFSDRTEGCIPPRRGRTAAMRLVREVLATEPRPRRTDIGAALRFLNRVQKRRAVVFLVSDFQSDGYWAELQVTARRHDLICCSIRDPREASLTPAGVLGVLDPETGTARLLDSSSARVRGRYRDERARQWAALEAQLARLGVDHLRIDTDRPFIHEIHRLFRQRRRRLNRA